MPCKVVSRYLPLTVGGVWQLNFIRTRRPARTALCPAPHPALRTPPLTPRPAPHPTPHPTPRPSPHASPHAPPRLQSEQKWKQLAELATSRCEFGLAQRCLQAANDFAALLLLATSAADAPAVGRLAAAAATAGQNNVAFLSYFVLGK